MILSYDHSAVGDEMMKAGEMIPRDGVTEQIRTLPCWCDQLATHW